MEFFHDVNDKLFAFESVYLDVINEHAPLKQFHVGAIKYRSWMNNGAKPFGIETSCGKSLLMIAQMLITPFTKKKKE